MRVLRAAVAEHHPPVCWLCAGLIGHGAPLDPDDRSWHVDHRVPRSRGGTDDVDNLAPAHAACNTSRGNRPPPAPTAAHRWAL